MNLSSANLTFEYGDMKPNERLWQLILHIARICEGDKTFGKVKLAKILYFADFTSFRLYGQPITGAKYVRFPNGPVPEIFWDTLAEMKSTEAIAFRVERLYDYEQHRILALHEPDLTIFSGRDIALVDEIISQCRNKTAMQLSDMSHGIAWRLVGDKEAIPYQASLLSDEGITQEDIDHVQELAKIYGSEPQ